MSMNVHFRLEDLAVLVPRSIFWDASDSSSSPEVRVTAGSGRQRAVVKEH